MPTLKTHGDIQQFHSFIFFLLFFVLLCFSFSLWTRARAYTDACSFVCFASFHSRIVCCSRCGDPNDSRSAQHKIIFSYFFFFPRRNFVFPIQLSSFRNCIQNTQQTANRTWFFTLQQRNKTASKSKFNFSQSKIVCVACCHCCCCWLKTCPTTQQKSVKGQFNWFDIQWQTRESIRFVLDTRNRSEYRYTVDYWLDDRDRDRKIVEKKTFTSIGSVCQFDEVCEINVEISSCAWFFYCTFLSFFFFLSLVFCFDFHTRNIVSRARNELAFHIDRTKLPFRLFRLSSYARKIHIQNDRLNISCDSQVSISFSPFFAYLFIVSRQRLFLLFAHRCHFFAQQCDRLLFAFDLFQLQMNKEIKKKRNKINENSDEKWCYKRSISDC